ncbi:MAG: HTH domain-containing protein [Saprospiraceae bacterium]|nr:HTH domain-containing protein [Saprospiraceae bacterium]
MKLTWSNAIKKVLSEEGKPLRYDEIVQKIFEKEYRQKGVATPEGTVLSILSIDIKKNGEDSAFIRVNPGEYTLRKGVMIPSILQEATKEEEIEEQKEIEKNVDIPVKKSLVKAYGIYWKKENVRWKNNPKILGIQGRSKGVTSVDFSKQTGIYLLYDAKEIVYVGRTTDTTLGQRLYDHYTKTRFEGRWDRFSWFGFK